MAVAAIRLIDGTTGARLPTKPPSGLPCNGCGFCCAAEPCGIAREFIGADSEGRCPALEWDGARFGCGMILRPGHYLGVPAWADAEICATVAQALGAGRGCCADDPES